MPLNKALGVKLIEERNPLKKYKSIRHHSASQELVFIMAGSSPVRVVGK